MALLLNMARRLNFAIAQSITIIGWFLSSFLLIAILASTSSTASLLPEKHALTQAFYYGALAAGLYFCISCLMIVTVLGTYLGHYPKEFQLTFAQRTLMLQTIAFMAYLLLGALIYKNIEGWEYLDAVYWANFTLLTIGIGADFVPKTHLGRSLLFPFAMGGVLSVGLVIGSVRSLVLERGKEKMKARFVEKKRERALKSVNQRNRTIQVSWFKKYTFSEDGLTEPQRREQEFGIMRKIQEEAYNRQRYMALTMSTTAALALWFVGAAVFSAAEQPQGWSYFVALYFSYTSLMTIGYGDIQPTSNSGKPFFVFWTLLAVPTLTILISHMGDTVIKSFSELTIWAGTITVLPGEHSFVESLKIAIRRFTRNEKLNSKELRIDKPPGFAPYSADGQDPKGEGTSEAQNIEEHALDRLAVYVEDEQLEDARAAEAEGDTRRRDLYLYHYVLVRELKLVMMDMRLDTPKEYSYRDWAWFLRLIEQNEDDPDLHSDPLRDLHTTTSRKEFGKADSGERKLQWSWLGVRSPLMAPHSEAEWIAERLSMRLEESMKRMGKNDYSESVPISINDLIKRQDDENKKGQQKAEDEPRLKKRQ
jgi:potassium channel subfamily K